jgi:hypothetical protein
MATQSNKVLSTLNVTPVTDDRKARVQKNESQNRKRSSGASNELLIERRDRAADAARCGFGHSRILLCGTIGVVVF